MATKGESRKVTEWRERMARFGSSGQNAKAFCKAEGVSETMFYRWRHRLQDDEPAQAAGFIALPSGASGGAPQSKTAPWELRLELGDGLVLHLARR